MKTRTHPSTRIIAFVLVAVAVLGLAFLHFRPHDDHRGGGRPLHLERYERQRGDPRS